MKERLTGSAWEDLAYVVNIGEAVLYFAYMKDNELERAVRSGKLATVNELFALDHGVLTRRVREVRKTLWNK